MAGMIDAYLTQLDRRLAFDPALSARVCAEVEDHLRESADSERSVGRIEAEQHAVQRFGGVDELAARFAADNLSALTTRTWTALAATAGAAFLAMRLRRMLLDAGAFDALPAAALADRFAFIAALAAGLVGWLIVRMSPAPTLRRFRIANMAAAVSAIALAISIAGGGLIATAAGRQFELPTLAAFLLEAAMAGWLAVLVWRLAHRTAAATRALKG